MSQFEDEIRRRAHLQLALDEARAKLKEFDSPNKPKTPENTIYEKLSKEDKIKFKKNYQEQINNYQKELDNEDKGGGISIDISGPVNFLKKLRFKRSEKS